MNNKSCWVSVLVAVFLVLTLVPSAVFADGFRNPPEGAAAFGACGGHRVFADDANATIHNSANLVDLEQSTVQLNLMGGYGHNEFETADGAISDKTEKPVFVIPGFSAVMPLQAGKTAFGISAYVPFGRSVDWGNDGFFAQNGVPYSGSMSVMDITPNFSVRLNKALSFGIGADIYNGSVEQQMLFVGPVAQALGLPAGAKSKLTADGAALGCNAALAWKLTDNQRLAATIRSPFSIDYSGQNRIDYAGSLAAEGTIDYPTIVALAYGIELTDTLRVEADVEWLEFSTYQELTIQDQFGTTTTTAQNLEDTWTAGIGAEWEFAPQWTLRSGFMHLQNPTPDETYSPLSPDEDQQVVSVGLGYETEHHAVDLAYAYGIFNGRDISGSANSPDGHYDYDVQVLSLSYGYKF
jgi:long-chain fatty acid transport protein